ncbi:DUF6624 domain-containing protein [uncultured Croceitalea sp.]|uniref:DUF6624 domain-containing protein n=1 Tax=uncultured Croceitalea sp. TaxID=1798908 RepID=UPI0033068654
MKNSYFLLLITLVAISCVNNTSKKNQIHNDNYLVAVLDTIWRTEQEPLNSRDSIGRIHGFESPQFKEQQLICDANHAINEKKIIEILELIGWPNGAAIKEQQNLTICNVLQHSGIEIRKKYLPLMKDAVNNGELQARFLARAGDRLATDEGGLQVYGGQMKYYSETKSFNLWPVLDPKNIDKRRAKIGLEPIAEYLKNRFDFEWNLEEQIKRTAEFEKETNKTHN